MSDTQKLQVVNIPTTKLIERLQQRVAEEQAKRAEAEAKATAAMKEYTEAVVAFSTDELVNIFRTYVATGSSSASARWLQDVKKEEKFVSPAAAPSNEEHRLEKQIRVFQMTSDETVALSVTDPLYLEL